MKKVTPLALFLLLATSAAFAQTDPAKSKNASPTESQKSFEKLKALAGTWEGPVSTNLKKTPVDGKTMHVTLRVTSMGNALMHEMTSAERPDDPITMFYLDADNLTLTHYCDAGNRPRMLGKMSPDGKTLEFQFTDVAGSTEYGHMHGAMFTFIDDTHHTEDWTYMAPNGQPVHAHVELQRVK